jgi:hypothetical protein
MVSVGLVVVVVVVGGGDDVALVRPRLIIAIQVDSHYGGRQGMQDEPERVWCLSRGNDVVCGCGGVGNGGGGDDNDDDCGFVLCDAKLGQWVG